MQSANDEVHKTMMETAALPDHLHIITSQTLINSFPFFWLKIVIFMPLIFKMKEWKYSCIVPPVRKVLVQWWGCGAAGIKSEKYFPQMVVNIAWQHMACNFKWLFFFLCWPVSLTLLSLREIRCNSLTFTSP